MKISLCVVALLLCFALALTGCVMITDDRLEDNAPSKSDPVDTGAATQGFVAPADAVGKVVSVSEGIITWYAFPTDEESIDFMKVKVTKLGDAAEEMSLLYLEDNVSYYMIKGGKLIDAVRADAVKGSIIGVTTLEEGVQEIYILSVPVEEEEVYEEETEPTIEEIVDDVTMPTT